MKLLVLLTITGLLQTVSPAQEHGSHSGQHWTYSGSGGPQHWGELNPEYAACKTGGEQSPIDIRDAKPAELPKIVVDYHSTPLKIINNGHTIQIDYAPGSFITVGDKKYQLVQFHFHHPSEEKINGHASDMVAHLVHKDEAGHLAVIAVLLKNGNPNALIQQLWSQIPKEIGKQKSVESMHVNAADLLPKDTGYYTFMGSLTTPPCTEGVRWYVMKEPVDLSSSQVAVFGKFYPDNARPIQPLHGRVIEESK